MNQFLADLYRRAETEIGEKSLGLTSFSAIILGITWFNCSILVDDPKIFNSWSKGKIFLKFASISGIMGFMSYLCAKNWAKLIVNKFTSDCLKICNLVKTANLEECLELQAALVAHPTFFSTIDFFCNKNCIGEILTAKQNVITALVSKLSEYEVSAEGLQNIIPTKEAMYKLLKWQLIKINSFAAIFMLMMVWHDKKSLIKK